MKQLLCEWEENGYDDSDGFSAYWDSERQTVDKEMTWTTRGGVHPSEFQPLTPDALAAALAWLENHIFDGITAAEQHDILTPADAPIGREMELLVDHNFSDKRAGVKHELKAGQWGDVFWCGAFGQFYRNGYNRPGRDNRRVGLRMSHDGSRVFVPLSKLRQHRQPLTAEELRQRAHTLAQGCQFGAALSSRFAWDSRNQAAELLKTLEAADKAA